MVSIIRKSTTGLKAAPCTPTMKPVDTKKGQADKRVVQKTKCALLYSGFLIFAHLVSFGACRPCGSSATILFPVGFHELVPDCDVPAEVGLGAAGPSMRVAAPPCPL